MVRGVSPLGWLCCVMADDVQVVVGAMNLNSFSFHPAKQFEGDEAVFGKCYPPLLLGQNRFKYPLCCGKRATSALASLLLVLRQGGVGMQRLQPTPPQGTAGLPWGCGPSLVSVYLPGLSGSSGALEPPGASGSVRHHGSWYPCTPRALAHAAASASSSASLLFLWLLLYLSPIRSWDLFLPPRRPNLPPFPLKLQTLLENPAWAGQGGQWGASIASGPTPCPRGAAAAGRGAPALAGKVPPRPPPCAAAAEPRQGDYEDVSRSGGRREGRRAPDEVLGEPRRVIHVRPCVCV